MVVIIVIVLSLLMVNKSDVLNCRRSWLNLPQDAAVVAVMVLGDAVMVIARLLVPALADGPAFGSGKNVFGFASQGIGTGKPGTAVSLEGDDVVARVISPAVMLFKQIMHISSP
jgi:hypothetical protein